MIGAAVLFCAVFAVSMVGTDAIRRYAIARDMLDRPNHRSSHSVATPRGGGIALASAFAGATILLAVTGAVEWREATAIVGPGILVASVGLLDDRRDVPAQWRLLAHFLAAIWAVASLAGLRTVNAQVGPPWLTWAGDAMSVVGLVWLLNLYNFMDGIDGIAGVEAVTVCLGGAALAAIQPGGGADPLLPIALAAASLGFLYWNFPVARIFMGDAGSGFLGLVIGVLGLRAGSVFPPALWGWIILLGVFVVDATFTLLKRLRRREPVHQAHRSHAYQQAARLAGNHRAVTITVGLINLFWLFPWALLVTLRRIDPLIGTMIAYAPIVALAARMKAGNH